MESVIEPDLYCNSSPRDSSVGIVMAGPLIDFMDPQINFL
jgi:hypothetical protein